MRRENVISAIRILSPTARMVTAVTFRERRHTMPTDVGASLGVPSGLHLLERVLERKFESAGVAVVRVVKRTLRPFAPLAKLDVDETTFVRHVFFENQNFPSR